MPRIDFTSLSDLDREMLGYSKLNEAQQITWTLILKEFYANQYDLLALDYPQENESELQSLQESEIFTSILKGNLKWLIRDTKIRGPNLVWIHYNEDIINLI